MTNILTASPASPTSTIADSNLTYPYATGSYGLAATGSSGIFAGKIDINKNLTLPHGADLKVGDVSLKDFMKEVTQRLGILTINPMLEKEWEELKVLGDQYRALEKEINEKVKVWNILKKE